MKTWILVADASRARLFQAEDGRDVTMVWEQENPRGRARNQELVTDEPGRLTKGRGRNVLSAMDGPTSAHETAAIRFAGAIAARLNDSFSRLAFQSLVLVAPPRFLGVLRQKLAESVAKAVVVERARDYSGLPEPELHPHIVALLAESLQSGL